MCGIIGASGPCQRLAPLLVKGLFALQHRGQEAAGVALFDGELRVHKGVGLVNQVFKRGELFNFEATVGVGHTRYSTHGASVLANAQPLVARHKGSVYAIAHNGNISNALALRRQLEERGVIFTTTSDTEIILYLYATGKGSPAERLKALASALMGAYSLTILHDDALVLVRDPHGFRPLSLGRLGDTVIAASEDSAFNLLGARKERDLEPGEILVFREGKLVERDFIGLKRPRAQCVFELIYFARPDSVVFGHQAYLFRKGCGRALAKREREAVDIVVPVPDSGFPAALGFAEELGAPVELGLIRNHYVGRSFIQPGQRSRREAVRQKLLPLKEVLKDRRIALVDDSIVRGTTSKLIIELVREFGAKEVHVRIASPPLTSPCFFGIDMPTKEELLASSRTVEEIREFLGADSLRYLSVEDLAGCLGEDAGRFCFACFTGRYPEGSVPPEGATRTVRVY